MLSHLLSQLLFPAPFRFHFLTSVAFFTALLFGRNRAACEGVLAAGHGPAALILPIASRLAALARPPAGADPLSPEDLAAGRVDECALAVYIAHLGVGVLLPSALYHARELSARIAFVAALRLGGAAPSESQATLVGTSWGSVLAATYGIAGAVAMVWWGNYSAYPLCLHLLVLRAITYLVT